MIKKRERKKGKQIVDEEEEVDGNKRRNRGFHMLQIRMTNIQRHDSYIYYVGEKL